MRDTIIRVTRLHVSNSVYVGVGQPYEVETQGGLVGRYTWTWKSKAHLQVGETVEISTLPSGKPYYIEGTRGARVIDPV